MMIRSQTDTIFALSSGSLPSGVAVIRISGDMCAEINLGLKLDLLVARQAALRDIFDPNTGEIIDQGVCIWFPAPASFTGESCLELQVHGGKAVVSKILLVLSSFENCRLAEQGEFSRRAFENGKLDLTEIEGLGDLITAETEIQRKQAQAQASGKFRYKLEIWREQLIQCRAFLEVEFDFSDEDDVPDSMLEEVQSKLASLSSEIDAHLNDENRGEIVREGYKVVLAGAPNSGKSSLLNALAGRDIAIVSNRAGTTRDVLECKLDISGIPVIFYDTAGIRQTADDLELEGIRRALAQSENADLTIWLSSLVDPVEPSPDMMSASIFHSKSDLISDDFEKCINTVHPNGLDPLIQFIHDKVAVFQDYAEPSLITKQRHRLELEIVSKCLIRAQALISVNAVLAAEELRTAGDSLGRLTGFIDVEDLLDVIFSDFCIGK